MTLSRQLIEVGWRLVESGLTDGRSGNISARFPDGTTALITPSARDYRLLTERDLVRIRLDSERAEGQRPPSSEWRLHASIYRVREEVGGIIHHHATWASAVAVARKTIPVLIDEAADIGPIPTAAYAPSASQALAESASREFANGANVVLLANHGAVAVGRDLEEAWRRAVEVERLAKIYIGAELLGGAQVLDQTDIDVSRRFFEGYRAAPPEGAEPFVPAPPIVGPVSFHDLLNYSFRAGVTFASLMHSLITQKLHR